MSNEVYPALPGLSYGVRRRPMWSTDVRITPTGREYRSSDQIYPRFRLQLAYEYLRSGLFSEQHLETLEGFFNRHKGSLESFLVDDPDDSSVVDQLAGVGDGLTTAYQLVRTRGGFVQPVDFINGSPVVTLSDWQGDRVRLSGAGRTNLLVRSASFNNGSWVKNGGAVAGDNANGPDGSLTADTFTDSTANATHHVRQTVTTSPAQRLAFMAHVKLGTRPLIKLRLSRADFSSSCSANFDLSTGQTGLVNAAGNGSVFSASITPAGNGFFRVELVGNADTVSDATMVATIHTLLADVDNPTHTGDGLGTLILGDAMLVAGDFAGRYIATTTVAVAAPADYSITASTAKLTLATAPVAGAPLRWTGSYYWRARFEQDELDFEKFLDTLWKTSRVDLISTRS